MSVCLFFSICLLYQKVSSTRFIVLSVLFTDASQDLKKKIKVFKE